MCYYNAGKFTCNSLFFRCTLFFFSKKCRLTGHIPFFGRLFSFIVEKFRTTVRFGCGTPMFVLRNSVSFLLHKGGPTLRFPFCHAVPIESNLLTKSNCIVSCSQELLFLINFCSVPVWFSFAVTHFLPTQASSVRCCKTQFLQNL